MSDLHIQQQKEVKRQDLIKLVNQKDEMEKTIMDLTEFLETPPMPGVKGPLVDSEGFPRGDIDLIEVRKMRHRLACLQTDHCNLMKQIENEMFSLHEVYKQHNINEPG